MKTRDGLIVGACCVLMAMMGSAGGADLPAWRGDTLGVWMQRGHQVKSAKVENGVLKIVCGGMDTHIYSSAFDIPAKPAQELVFRAKGTCGGSGELFWMQPGKGPTQNLAKGFEWIGDGAWHEYRVRPYWQGEKRIGCLRIDFPSAANSGAVYEIDSIRIEEGKDAIAVSAEEHTGVSFSLASKTDELVQVLWAGDGASGVKKEEVRVPGDGRRHRYYLPMMGHTAWQGMIGLMRVETPAGVAAPDDLKFETEEPELPPDLVVASARATDAFNRVGANVPVMVQVRNLGTVDAPGTTVVPVSLPQGVRVVNAAALTGTAYGCETTSFTTELDCAAAGDYTVTFEVRAPGVRTVTATAQVKVLPSLALPKSAYVPEPKPVATDYDLAALYFPGWARSEAWARVWRKCPERKPVLGWYDEANPECVDWQIKWLVENGIRTLYVDWYWSRGSQFLDHWVKAFYKAKYRRHMKWAMMWANHNAPGSHSIEDQRAVTKFWIENYFNTPEYLRIDDKPVVWMWSPENMNRDVGPNGCHRLLDLSREMAVAAGFKGIHFIAMKWPEADASAKTIQKYKDMGFDMTGIYHFMDHGGRCPTYRRFPYSACADANPANWWKQHEANVLPFIPNLSTGWDDRPWNDHCEIYGKNADDFRRICVEAKKFADQTGVKRICLSPLNEWGEGSYAEPNAEHGFGFYEAVRDVFCKKPAEGWPLNYGPKDVGLGPYDLPPPPRPEHATSWTFTDGAAHGWNEMMGVKNFKAGPEGLSFTTDTCDPAIYASFFPVAAKDFDRVVVRMKASGAKGLAAQLFWAGVGGKAHESASVHRDLFADGAFHDYMFPVSRSPEWRARVNHFRFDPCSVPGVKFTIESIRLVKGK